MKFASSLRFALLVVGGTCAVVGAAAPVPPVPDTLDLSQALRYAVDNNFAIRQARERIREQDGVLLEVRARQIPQVAASASYSANDKAVATSAPATDRNWGVEIQASRSEERRGGKEC